MAKDIVEIYRECQDFQEAVRLSGLSPIAAHMKLISSGVVKISDKIKHGSENIRRGALAEELFQKLVPKAVDANKYIGNNNPDFDFMVGNLKIDVKYSSLRVPKKDKIRKKKTWAIRLTGKKDLTVAFLERETGSELQKPHCLVIPNALMVNNCHMSITEDSERLFDFKVPLNELNDVIMLYADASNGGLHV